MNRFVVESRSSVGGEWQPGVYRIELFRIFARNEPYGADLRFRLLPGSFRRSAPSDNRIPLLHDTCCRHPHRAGLYCRSVSRCVAFGPPGRQCRILHRQPPHAVVYGRFCHDRGGDVGRHLHLGAGIGGRRFLLLHADGGGLHGGTACGGLRADPDLLPPAGRLALRIPRRPLRCRLTPHGSVVFLRVEDVGRCAAGLCGLCGAAFRFGPMP